MERSSRLPRLQKTGQGFILLIILLTSVLVCFGSQPVPIPAKGSIYYPPASEVLFADGFENGDFSSWNGTYLSTGNNASVSLANPYDGSYSARFQANPAASGVSYAYSYIQLSASVTEVYARAYFCVLEGLPLVDNEDRVGLIGFEIGGQLQGTFRIYRSGNVDRFNIIAVNGTSSVSVSTDAVYPTGGKWFCIEFYIRVHESIGEYRAWIDGIQQIAIENVNTATYGSFVNRVRFGLTYDANIQQYVDLLCDSVVVSTRYVGQEYSFGVIGSPIEKPAINNFYWLFDNQSIRYRILLPSEVRSSFDIELLDGLIIWTRQGGYNTTAIKQFAQTKVVISDVIDFCKIVYPSLSTSTQVVATGTVTYMQDWGNFRKADLCEMRNETGDVDKLTTVLSSSLLVFTNVTALAQYNSTRVAFFHMNGTTPNSGFYVMDLDATTPTTEWAGIWHLFPAIKAVKDFPTGKYARWFAHGIELWTYDEIEAWLSNWVANAPKGMNASLIRIGKSVLGRDINATRFGNGSRYLCVDAAMHGDEKNPALATLRLLEVIQEDFEAGGYWKSRLEEVSIIVIPILNPDGFVANQRYNANGIDLDRQFPPQNTTEPEAWAMRWLWGNYSEVTDITLHEGRHWQPLDYFYATNSSADTYEIKEFSKQNCYWTADDFGALGHWGYYNESTWSTNPIDISYPRLIASHSGGAGQIDIGASNMYNISAYLIESFVWAGSYNGTTHKARQILYATDFYVATVLGLFSHLDRLRSQDLLVVAQGRVSSFKWTDRLQLRIDTSQLAHPEISTTKIDVGGRPKPLSVFVDGVAESQGNGWSYSSGIVTVTGAKDSIEISW